jgi:hypothetical protein
VPQGGVAATAAECALSELHVRKSASARIGVLDQNVDWGAFE